jgi:hypothetical protein
MLNCTFRGISVKILMDFLKRQVEFKDHLKELISRGTNKSLVDRKMGFK